MPIDILKIRAEIHHDIFSVEKKNIKTFYILSHHTLKASSMKPSHDIAILYRYFLIIIKTFFFFIYYIIHI